MSYPMRKVAECLLGPRLTYHTRGEEPNWTKWPGYEAMEVRLMLHAEDLEQARGSGRDWARERYWALLRVALPKDERVTVAYHLGTGRVFGFYPRDSTRVRALKAGAVLSEVRIGVQRITSALNVHHPKLKTLADAAFVFVFQTSNVTDDPEEPEPPAKEPPMAKAQPPADPFMPAHLSPPPNGKAPAKPPTPPPSAAQRAAPLLLPVDEEVSRLVTRRRKVSLPLSALMAVIREAMRNSGTELPEDARVLIAWADRKEESPHLKAEDVVRVEWHETREEPVT